MDDTTGVWLSRGVLAHSLGAAHLAETCQGRPPARCSFSQHGLQSPEPLSGLISRMASLLGLGQEDRRTPHQVSEMTSRCVTY